MTIKKDKIELYTVFIVRAVAISCMAMATIYPFTHVDHFFAQENVNISISYFWAAWFMVWMGFAITAFFDNKKMKGLFALSIALIGLDTIRIRLELLDKLFDAGPSSPLVYLVRIVAGWFFVYYLAFYARNRKESVNA